jgi:hypothetical protein
MATKWNWRFAARNSLTVTRLSALGMDVNDPVVE